MAQICVPVLALLVLCTIGLNCSEAKSVRRRGCCTMYTSKPVPIKAIRGFSIQPSNARCKLDAVIFYTEKRRGICVDPKLSWVSSVIETLKAQIKEMQQRKQQ